jgi:hypothetical protein
MPKQSWKTLPHTQLILLFRTELTHLALVLPSRTLPCPSSHTLSQKSSLRKFACSVAGIPSTPSEEPALFIISKQTAEIASFTSMKTPENQCTAQSLARSFHPFEYHLVRKLLHVHCQSIPCSSPWRVLLQPEQGPLLCLVRCRSCLSITLTCTKRLSRNSCITHLLTTISSKASLLAYGGDLPQDFVKK